MNYNAKSFFLIHSSDSCVFILFSVIIKIRLLLCKPVTDLDECHEGANKCDQICVNEKGSYSCLCKDGYLLYDEHSCQGTEILFSDYNNIMYVHYWFISDINECQTDNGGCTQTCDNTNGFYQCSCWDGYELTSDNHTCVGKCLFCIACE